MAFQLAADCQTYDLLWVVVTPLLGDLTDEEVGCWLELSVKHGEISLLDLWEK